MQKVRVVGALIEKEGRMLIVQRRPGGEFGGKWEFPGGKVQRGEADEQALSRELKEELDISIRVGERYFETEHDYKTLSVHLVFYSCEISDTSEIKLLEHQQMAWAARDELELFDFLEADRLLIEKLMVA